MNRKLILIGGYCATGKTTFSRRLAGQLGWLCLNKDTFKEVFADSYGSTGETYDSRLSVAAVSLMTHVAERMFVVGQPVILESNFRQYEVDVLSELAEQYGYRCLTYVFTADMDVVYTRYTSREDTPERHPVHKSLKNMSARDFALYHKPFGEIQLGQRLSVDATDFSRVDYPSLLAAAQEFAVSG